MTGAIDTTQLCFSSNVAGIVANKIEQSFYSVPSYSRIESIEHTLISITLPQPPPPPTPIQDSIYLPVRPLLPPF